MTDFPRHAKYFDHAATTPLHPQVRAAMEPYWCEEFGNSHSPHAYGEHARVAIRAAQEQIAAVFDSDPLGVILTSGATEANQLILNSFSRVVTSPIEHSSIHALGLPILGPQIAESTQLVSQMVVNNETGEILPEPPSGPWLIHRDATQAVGWLDMQTCPGDAFTISGHKIFGPMGIGALVCRSAIPILPMFKGAEGEFRAGTVPLPLVVGLGAACELAVQERADRVRHASALRLKFLEQITGHPECLVLESLGQAPHILCLAFKNIEGAALVLAADAKGFAISSGAACSTGSTEPSHVIQNRNLPLEYRRGAIRISLGPANTLQSTQELASAIIAGARDLRQLGR